MKKLFLGLLLFLSLIVNAATYYVAPWGDDDAPGTLEQPWATWQKAIRTARAGDIVYFRGGIYYTTTTQSCVPPVYGHNGTKAEPICYFNYPGEVPVLDGINCTTTTTGLSFQGASNIHIKGLHVRNFLQHESNNSFGTCIAFSDGNNITIEQCVAYNAGMRGFYLHDCDTALILNCDAYNCCDSISTGYEGGGGDGFLVWDSGIAADSVDYVVLKGCRSWHNSDDGYDIETEGYIGVESCWAWNNGYLKGDGDGFKFGFKDHSTVGLSRQFTNCLAVYNKFYGFDENSAAFQCMTANVFNCTSYGNDQIGFSTCNDCLNPKINTYKNNIAYSDARSMPQLTGQMKDSYNSWNIPPGVTITDADFISVDSTGISGPRKVDGSLPDLSFLKLASTSDLIDAGMDVGLLYYGSAPDLGWSETNYGTEVFVNSISVTGAEDATSIVTDNGILQLNKTVLPAEATNKSVRWSIASGTEFAAVSSTGLVTAIKDGLVTVKATANDGSGVYGTITITISNQVIPITGITVTGAGGTSTIAIDNGTLQLSAAVLPSDATNKTVTWSVTNGTGQASISSSGLITAVKNGTVTAKAAANDGSGVTGTLNITISNQVIPISDIAVTGAGGTSAITTDNGTLQLSAAVLPSNATDKTVAWSVINGTGQATISSTGLLTAISDGTITAKAVANDGSGVSGTLNIFITNQIVLISSIMVTSDGGVNTIFVDKEILQQNIEELTSSFENKVIPGCSVRDTGHCIYNASNLLPAVAYRINADENAAGGEGTLQLYADVMPDSVTDKTVTWSITSGTEHAVISSTGLVTAISPGHITVAANANDGSGVKGTLEITIAEKAALVESIVVSPSDGSIPVIRVRNGHLQMKAEILPENASNSQIDWDIENLSGIATIDKNGLVTGVADGSVKVIARASDGSGISGYCMVAVSNQAVPAFYSNTHDSGFYTFLTPGKLIIRSDNQPDELLYSVFNIQGVLIHSQTAFHYPVEINIDTYLSGCYIIVLYADQKYIPLKVVIP